MPQTLTIRRADADDREAVLHLWQALLDEQAELEPRFEIAEDAAERWRNDFAEWTRDETRRLFVAERENEVVAFLSAERYTPRPIYAGPREVYVNEVYVQPDVRGGGVGQRLVETTKTWADDIGAERLRLAVLIANEQGRAFWQRLDAKPLSETLTLSVESDPDRHASERESNIGF